jgi:adenylate cyclase
VARIIGNMGIVHIKTGDYPSALEHYRRALDMHEELGDHIGVARITGNMANVYLTTSDYAHALNLCERALAIFKELGDRTGIARVTGNIGTVYRRTGDYQSALIHFRSALDMHEELGDRAGVALITGNFIATLLDNGEYTEASHLLDQQSTMLMDDPAVRAEHSRHRSRVAEHQGDLDAAHEHTQKALNIAIETGLRDHASMYHERLRDLAQKRNDFAGYVEHNNEFLRITEEVRGKEATQRMAMMEAERKIEAELRERDKERALLYGALPESVATRMLRGEDVSGDHFEHASVLFMDIAGFTSISDRIPAGHVVHLLKAIFKVCDEACLRHGLTKIKTIGDSYLAVAGVPEPLDDHAQRAAQAALAMLRGLNELQLTMDPKFGDTSWTREVGEINVRIGLHCGPLVAGIVGEHRLQYDVWGDTVNVASRMESTGAPGRIHISEDVVRALKGLEGTGRDRRGLEGTGRDWEGPEGESSGTRSDVEPGTWNVEPGTWNLVPRGATEVKGKGTMTTYWLEPAT